MTAAGAGKAIPLTEVAAAIKKGVQENGAQTYLGSMVTTRGVLVLLFSHRLNKDFALLVMGSDTSKVLTKVFEALT